MEKRRGLLDRITNRDIIDSLNRQTQILSAEVLATSTQATQFKTELDTRTKETLDLKTQTETMQREITGLRKTVTDLQPPAAGFRSSDLYGSTTSFGRSITDTERLFNSQREPVLKWIVSHVSADIWDNGFKVYPVGKTDDKDLDNKVQNALLALDAKRQLTRATTFERRYGTSLMLYGYTENEDWEKPLTDEDKPVGFRNLEGMKILEITPYPKTKFTIDTEDYETDENSTRYGEPNFYRIQRSTSSSGKKTHWTKVTPIATRIDEDPFWGESVMDPVHDDATGFRNIRWSEYQLMFRYGSGFPHIKIPNASKAQIETWINAGEFKDLNSRTYFVTGQENEDIEFKGVQGVAVNPTPYNDLALDMMSMGTRIPKDVLRGASAGTLTGSETNLRSTAKYIESEQSSIEFVIRDLIDRLIETKQIEFDRGTPDKPNNYVIEWASAYEPFERDKANIEFQGESSNALRLKYMTIDEVRKMNGLKELPNGAGQVIPGLLELQVRAMQPTMQTPLIDTGRDKVIEASAFETDLLEEQLIENCFIKTGNGVMMKPDLTREDALARAEEIIDQHNKMSQSMALRRLAELTGHQVSEESPEAKSLREGLKQHYMEFFVKILDDALEAAK